MALRMGGRRMRLRIGGRKMRLSKIFRWEYGQLGYDFSNPTPLVMTNCEIAGASEPALYFAEWGEYPMFVEEIETTQPSQEVQYSSTAPTFDGTQWVLTDAVTETLPWGTTVLKDKYWLIDGLGSIFYGCIGWREIKVWEDYATPAECYPERSYASIFKKNTSTTARYCASENPEKYPKDGCNIGYNWFKREE